MCILNVVFELQFFPCISLPREMLFSVPLRTTDWKLIYFYILFSTFQTKTTFCSKNAFFARIKWKNFYVWCIINYHSIRALSAAMQYNNFMFGLSLYLCTRNKSVKKFNKYSYRFVFLNNWWWNLNTYFYISSSWNKNGHHRWSVL